MEPALIPPLAHVQVHGAEGADGEPLAGVDCNTEEAGIGVDELVLVTNHLVPEDTGTTQTGQVGYVIIDLTLGLGLDLLEDLPAMGRGGVWPRGFFE